MPEASARRQPLTRQVLQSLVDSIAARKLQPEDRLPTERDLAEELRVSRNTVREALGSLEAIGAVARSPKRGAVLKPIDLSALAGISQAFLLQSADDFQELLVARGALEAAVLPLVAQRASDADFQALEAANAQVAADAQAGRVPLEADLGFHKALLQASHNRFLIQFGRLLEEFFRACRSRTALDPAGQRRTLREHRQIIAALRSGNAGRAQRVLSRHLLPFVEAPLAAALPRAGGVRPARTPRRKRSAPDGGA